MSRRPDNKAAQNQQTIKGLLRLEANKMCADCKKNKHPRWASWNLGVFLCIRCSGIHRGMGTHISRVKSVDLDAWTDEQLQSIVRWGNARANKYWEAKLAPGHVPSDAKIENFIRTKYESKRWVMDGPMPDPSTLGGDGDDNVPLNVVRDKAQLDRSASQTGNSRSSGPPSAPGIRRPPTDSFDLIGADDPAPPPPRPNTTDPPPNAARAPPPPKPSTPSQLLGGLDFLGETPERPTSAGQKSGGMSRPDLKQSILSLYAAQPKPSPQSPPTQSPHDRQASFGGMSSPQQNITSPSMGGMNDAFAGLSFGSSSTAPKPSQSQNTQSSSAFGGLGQMSSPPVKSNPVPPQMTSLPMSGGGFFDAGPKPPPKPNAPKATGPSLAVRKTSNASDGFGDFTSGTSTAPSTSTNKSNNSSGLLDFTQTMVNIQPVANKPTSPPSNSVFNLSQQRETSNQPSAPSGQANYASKISADPWGSNAWASPDPAPAAKQTPVSSPPTKSGGADFGWGSSNIGGTSSFSNEWSQPSSTNKTDTSSASGWGNESGFGGGNSSASFGPPKVTAEEDFGGWASSTAPTGSNTQSSNTAAPKPFSGGTDDLFSNVWG